MISRYEVPAAAPPPLSSGDLLETDEKVHVERTGNLHDCLNCRICIRIFELGDLLLRDTDALGDFGLAPAPLTSHGSELQGKNQLGRNRDMDAPFICLRRPVRMRQVHPFHEVGLDPSLDRLLGIRIDVCLAIREGLTAGGVRELDQMPTPLLTHIGDVLQRGIHLMGAHVSFTPD